MVKSCGEPPPQFSAQKLEKKIIQRLSFDPLLSLLGILNWKMLRIENRLSSLPQCHFDAVAPAAALAVAPAGAGALGPLRDWRQAGKLCGWACEAEAAN